MTVLQEFRKLHSSVSRPNSGKIVQLNIIKTLLTINTPTVTEARPTHRASGKSSDVAIQLHVGPVKAEKTATTMKARSSGGTWSKFDS